MLRSAHSSTVGILKFCAALDEQNPRNNSLRDGCAKKCGHDFSTEDSITNEKSMRPTKKTPLHCSDISLDFDTKFPRRILPFALSVESGRHAATPQFFPRFPMMTVVIADKVNLAREPQGSHH